MKSKAPTQRDKRSLKYQRVRENLRRQITDGTLPPGSRLPTEADMPRQFGVSELTIRRALGDLAREGLIVRKRGSGSFVADPHHPPLLPGRTVRIGLLSAYPCSPKGVEQGHYGELTNGILSEWGLFETQPQGLGTRKKNAFRLGWSSPDRGLTVELLSEPLGKQKRYPSVPDVKAGQYDGLITVSIQDEAWLEKVLKLGLPTVLADFSKARFTDKADRVYFDPFDGYSDAVRYFYEQGCKKIHFLGGVEGLPDGKRGKRRTSGTSEKSSANRICLDTYLRLNAYQQEMEACGLSVPDSFIHIGTPTKQMVREICALDEHLRPDAVVCHGLYQSEQLVEAFTQRGWPLQGAGAAGAPPFRGGFPIMADGRALGAAAAALLVARLQRPERPALRVGVTMAFRPLNG